MTDSRYTSEYIQMKKGDCLGRGAIVTRKLHLIGLVALNIEG